MMTGLSNEQIVSLLGNHSFWARRACREILDRKDEFAPLLLKILDKAVSERDPDTWDFYDLLCPASLLLAQMRVTDAYPRLISLLSYEEDDLEYVWGDWLFEVVPFMLRDTYNGNPELLKALIENCSISPWARMMGVSVFGRHYYDGHISREEIVTYLRRLANEVYCGKTTHDDKLILTEIGSCARDQQLPELIDDVKALYARDDIDKSVYGDLASYLEDFDDPVDRDAERHADAIGDLETWRWFEKKEEKNNDDDDKDDESYDDDAIGRNDPCPCGSGKKYKHCHGRR